VSYVPSKVLDFSAFSCRFEEKNKGGKAPAMAKRQKGRGLTTLAALRAPQRPGEYIYRRCRTFRPESSETMTRTSGIPKRHEVKKRGGKQKKKKKKGRKYDGANDKEFRAKGFRGDFQ
jgi:hypothetical protein